MDKRLKPGHFYIVGSKPEGTACCLYIDFKGNILRFKYFLFDEGYEFESMEYYISEDLIKEAQEIPTPQIAWIHSQYSLFSDQLSGSIFTLTIFPNGVPEKFKERICSLEDVQRLMEKYKGIIVEGIGTFIKTSKGLSCFGYHRKELYVLCRDFFQPKWLLAEFGFTLEGMERFLSEGRFSSWEDTEYKPGFYEFHGVVTYLPKHPQYIGNKLHVPRFILDDESGCYIYDGFSPSTPCNLMNYMTEMYVGVRLCQDVVPNSCRGLLILSEVFGSCKELTGDKVIWTEEDLMENIDDLLGEDYELEIPCFGMRFASKDRRIQMPPISMRGQVGIPEMRALFLMQK